MKVLFDTCLWIDDLRRETLRPLLPQVRGRYFAWMDSVAVGELMAGCSGKLERRIVGELIRPFQAAGRVITPTQRDYLRAGEAISYLRSRGISFRNPGSALLDAVQAADALRIGALLVTNNVSDFSRLAAYIPCRVEPFERFRRTLWSGSSS